MSLDMTTPAAPTGDVGHDFDPFAPDYLADPYPILDALRERVPVFYAPALDMWVVTRFAEIDEIKQCASQSKVAGSAGIIRYKSRRGHFV